MTPLDFGQDRLPPPRSLAPLVARAEAAIEFDGYFLERTRIR